MPALHKNRVKMTVTSVASAGVGTITLNAASSAHQSFGTAYGANATVDILITEGTSWEVARNCTYTHSGTTVTRGTLEASSTGSAVTFTSAAVVEEIATAQFGNDFETAKQTYITGLLVTKNSGANTLDITAGSCYDPSSSKIISYAGATGVSAGSLGVSQWNQVYIYDNAGTATIEVVNNANPPSTTYAGTARQGGTNSNRRWIGCFLTNASSNILGNVVIESGSNQITVEYSVSTFAAPYLVVNNVIQTSYTSQSLATIMPAYVCGEAYIWTLMGGGGGWHTLYLSLDGASDFAFVRLYNDGTNNPGGTLWMPVIKATPNLYFKTESGKGIYLMVTGYKAAR